MMTNAAAQPCATCGELVSPGDHFCGSCGAAVSPIGGSPIGSAPVGGPAVGKTPAAVYDVHRGRTGRRVVAVIAGFLAVAAVSGLVVAFVDARRDLDTERDQLTLANNRVVELTERLDAADDPGDSLAQNLATAQQQLADVTAQLQRSQADLTAEREERAADAAANQTNSAAAVAAVQTQLDSVTAQLSVLQAAFPLDENSFRAASPAGEYAVTIQPIECTIVGCFELKSLSLSFPDATKVSGNRANGIISFADGSYTVAGDLAAEQAPFCNGVETDATFALAFHANRVVFENGLLLATELIGTYRETISGGECAGQFRSYSLTMTKA